MDARLYKTGLRQVANALVSLYSPTPEVIGHFRNDMHTIAGIAAETGHGEISRVAQDAEASADSLAVAETQLRQSANALGKPCNPTPEIINHSMHLIPLATAKTSHGKISKIAQDAEASARLLVEAESEAKSACVDAIGRLGQRLLSDMCDEVRRFNATEAPQEIKRRVLVVDDSRMASAALCNAFSAQEFAVRSANTLEESFFELLLFEPNILVSDVFMPQLEVELLGRAFRSLSRVRPSLLVLVSGATGEALQARLKKVEPDIFVSKTAGVAEVVSRVFATANERHRPALD
jgi:PleD family two-component response regulator